MSSSALATVYVRLLDEGTDVWRPVPALPVGAGRFLLRPTDAYDPDDEKWEFLPGTTVECATQFKSGGSVLVAMRSVDRDVDLRCQIVRWVSDEPIPGWIEARFTDATGKVWKLVDKVPIFTAEPLRAHSTYPRPGLVRCEALDRRTDPLGRAIVRVRAIDYPRNEADVEEFEVEEAQLLQPPSDIAGH